MLDVIEDHRAAVKYDLLAHDRRLEDLPSSSLTWGDAVTILTMQPPDRSALYRELNPEGYDQTKVAERLEQIIVMLARGQMLLGNQTEVLGSDLPNTYGDVYQSTAPTAARSDAEIDEEVQDSMAEIDRRMGWAN